MALNTSGSPDFKTAVKSVEAGDIVQTSESLGTVGNKATFKTGETVCAATGTAVQHAGQAIPDGYHVLILAKPSNTGSVYIGETKPIAEANLTAKIWELPAGSTIELKVDNFSDIWVDADTNDDGVDLIVESD